jgi:hypothetical protein
MPANKNIWRSLNVCVTKDQYEELRARAATEKLSIAEYVRRVLGFPPNNIDPLSGALVDSTTGKRPGMENK